jgi:hypothetical protein
MKLNCLLPVIRTSLSQKEIWSVGMLYHPVRFSLELESLHTNSAFAESRKAIPPIRDSQSVEMPHKLASGEELRLLPFLLAVPIVSIDIIIKHWLTIRTYSI